ncbi:MAG: NADH-quinone oxidoreductase subunit H [Actinomycetes bacterium]
MSALGWLVCGVAVVVGAFISPGCTGVIQTTKARLQGRRGTSITQPYRELRRLWGKSTVEPEGSSIIYRTAPAVVAAALGCALLVVASAIVPTSVPLASPLGWDFLLLFGLFALARFILALSAWDTGNGFGLLGVARDLMIAISAEVVMLLALVLAALPAASTDLRAMATASVGASVWTTPTHWCALLVFAIVAITEMGRQPIDNPDTHLELTMIHEGPLLEYSGRDLAYLQWAASARHVVLISIMVGVFLPHVESAWMQLVLALGWFLATLVGLAFVETLLAKMRLLRVPVFLGTSGVVALLGLASWFLVPAL